jgi:hypothetical protein
LQGRMVGRACVPSPTRPPVRAANLLRTMSEIEETPLPGVGTRYEFVTAGGERLCVIAHYSGRRELAFFDRGESGSPC